MNVLSFLRRLQFVERPRPALAEDERVTGEGIATFWQWKFGVGLSGPLIMTNKRLIWYETTRRWPIKPISGEVDLVDVVTVCTSGIFDMIGGGRPAVAPSKR